MSNYTIINVKIDVTKIVKARLFKGEKGTYLDATIFLSAEPDKHGQYGFIVQDLTREEREADPNGRGEIIGNVRRISGSKASAKPAPKKAEYEDDSDLPF